MSAAQKIKGQGGDPDGMRGRGQVLNAQGHKISLGNNSGNYELEKKKNCDVLGKKDSFLRSEKKSHI